MRRRWLSFGGIRALVTKPSTSAEWNGATANFTFTGDDVDQTANLDSWIRTNDTFTGNFRLTFTATTITGTARFGFYPVSADATFNQSSGSGNAGLGTTAGVFSVGQSPGSTINCYEANTSVATPSFTGGQVIIIERIGTVVTVTINGTLAHTFATASSGEVRIFTGSSSTAANHNMADVSWAQ